VTKLYGVSGDFALFTDDQRAQGVVIDIAHNIVDDAGDFSLLASAHRWAVEPTPVPKSALDLATGALADLSVQIVASAGRMYTIPAGAKAEAERGLKWRKEHGRGGTPVGVNTARTLARGGQIGIEKVRHIAKYFPRHEVDKKGKGYKPGQDGFPSAGRIAWALWGGDTAWRWARAIVERENKKKKSVRAGGYVVNENYAEYDDYNDLVSLRGDVEAFKLAKELGESGFGPEFVARVRLDGSGIDRVYKVENDGSVMVWDDGYWDSLGTTDGDVLTYDKALDDPYDSVEKDHILVDADSAMAICARLHQQPFMSVRAEDIDPEEAQLILLGLDELDWSEIEMAMVAAGEGGLDDESPGVYTPEERSEKAQGQVRDKGGRFAAMGSRVVVGGDMKNGRGSITGINPATQEVSVKLDNGNTVNVAANLTEKEEDAQQRAVAQEGGNTDTAPLDTSGILGQPRAPIDRPKAQIPGALPALSPEDLRTVLYDYPAWVKSMRDKQQAERFETPKPQQPVGDNAPEPEASEYRKGLEERSGKKTILDAKQHPMLKDFFKRKKESALYYSPITSAGAEKYAPTGKERGKALTPETSDVPPMYLALVSPDDPRAVLDLVAIVPKSTMMPSPMTFKRVDGKWEQDTQILADLSSPTPPPVVALDNSTYEDVLKQVDGAMTSSAEFAQGGIDKNRGNAGALVAKGGLDRNRGNAEKLRRYWLYGRGALKIRWNTPGDWTRCFRHLVKYMGPRAKGYCALRHKEATGLWTGDKLHRQIYGFGRNKAFSTDSIVAEERYIQLAALNAESNDVASRVITAGGYTDGPDGCAFYIPLVIPEDIESGDGRKFNKGAIAMRELPLPLLWQIKTGDGHNGSVVVGRIDTMERTEQGIGNATGVFDSGPYGREAERLVKSGFLRGVSADLDQFEADSEKAADVAGGDKKPDKIGGDKINITKARVMAVTIVPKPAFEQCKIQVTEAVEYAPQVIQEDTVIPDGEYTEEMDALAAESIVASGAIAASIPVVPPAGWFTDPKLDKPTPLTVDDAGRVFGHIAAWHVDHIGMTAGTKPPRSKSKYAYFHTGVVRADDGKDYAVGQLTLAGGHAPLEASARDAVKHYDDTASAIADVHAGEDSYGIWVAGALRPGTTPEQVRALRASAPSGDWRPIRGSLELVAVCQVNVPGFPIARALMASGKVHALVAAGAAVLAKLKADDPLLALNKRLEEVEKITKAPLEAQAQAAKARFAEAKAQRAAELAAKSEELSARVASAVGYDEAGYMPMTKRRKLADEGKALPDGSYPIRNVDELKDAIQAYGRGKKSKRAAIRRHIMKRARALDKSDLVPEKWKTASLFIEEDDVSTDELRARVASAKEIAQFADISPKVRERLAKTGKALPDGSYPIRNTSDLKNAIQAYGRANPEDRAKVRRHIVKRARALGKSDLIPENWEEAPKSAKED